MIVAPPSSGSRADPPRDLEAVHVRHVGVEQHERERLAAARPPRSAPRSAAAPLSTDGRPHLQRISRSCSMRRLTALSSTISTGRSVEVDGATAPARAAVTPRLHGEVERAALAGSLSTQIRPPISSTSVDEIVRPRPVPPNRRVVEPSACSNGSKIGCCLSSGMPMPVSLTEEVQQHAVGRRSTSTSTCTTICAALGELDRVADQVDAAPGAAGPDRRRAPSGTSGSTWQTSSRPFCSARSASGFSSVAEVIARVENGIGSSSSLPRLDLREVEDVVDDAQQRVGRALDHRRGTRAARRVSSVSSASSVMPMMPFIGVRISWLMLARNSLLAWFASSATRVAATSSAVRSRTLRSRSSVSARSSRVEALALASAPARAADTSRPAATACR